MTKEEVCAANKRFLLELSAATMTGLGAVLETGLEDYSTGG